MCLKLEVTILSVRAIRANGGVVTEALTLIDESEDARQDLEKAG